MKAEQIPIIVISVIVVLISLTFHEAAHAAAAAALGDPTARKQGRLSINPLVHIDIFGTIVLPILLAIMNLGVFGYAKPVPVDPSNLKHLRRDDALISAAGPGANCALAIVSALSIRFMMIINAPHEAASFIITILFLMIRINIFLMLFNLLPIPPLDGSGILHGVMSPRLYATYVNASRRLMLVFLFILLLTNWFSTFYLRPVGNVFFLILEHVAGIQLVW
ncbi:site-2 protease family protein [bacterium]|nr:site-2 protease family protein [candidate division CSSED10-310 bacterium]